MTYAMAPFQLHRPATAAEAVALAAAHPGAPYLAGGTDLMVNLRKRLGEPEHVIALHAVGELRGICEEPERLTVGALTSMSELAVHPTVAARLPMLAEAAAQVAGPTLRNMATLGGNLLLDTRCKYYNQSFFWRKANDFCLKKDGTVCHVAPKGTFCWAASCADTPPVLLLLGAELELAGPQGGRRVPLAGFYGEDGRWALGTAPGGLRPGELLVRVTIPLPAPGWAGAYEKVRVRGSIDYPLAGVALALRREEGGARPVTGLGLALTGVNPQPRAVDGLEALHGQPFDLKLLDELARRATRIAKPLRTTVADPAYRRAMVAALIAKAAARLAPELKAPLAERARWE